MTESVTIVVCGRPVPKGRPRIGSVNGRAMAFTPAATRKYEAHARLAAQEAMSGRTLLEGPVRVSIAAYLPIPSSWSGKRQRMAEAGLIKPTKRPDCDNYLKAALDSCNGIVFRDDAQVIDARVVKAYARKPRLEIRVESLTSDLHVSWLDHKQPVTQRLATQ